MPKTRTSSTRKPKTRGRHVRSGPKRKIRQGPLSVALPWLKRFGVMGGVCLVVIWLGAWLIVTGAAERTAQWVGAQVIEATAAAGLRVQSVVVEGRFYTDAGLIKALLNIETGAPLLGVDPREAKRLLEKTTWVRRADIQRRFPGTISIRLTERRVVARLSGDGGVWIDDEGAALRPDFGLRLPERPVVGPASVLGRPAELLFVLDMLRSDPALYARVVAAERRGGRRWDVVLRNGVVLKLPEDAQIGFALERLRDAHDAERVLDNSSIHSLDLRAPDRIIIQTKPGKLRDYQRT